MKQVKLYLSSKQAVILAGILGSSTSEVMYPVFEEIYDLLDEYEEELADEFTQHYINYNLPEEEILDDVIDILKGSDI